MRHVAKLYLTVVNFLHEDFKLQGMPFPANFGQFPVPITDNYFQYDSEEFAVAAGVESDALTPPDIPAPEEAGPGDVEEDPHGRDAPSEADLSVRNEDGSLPSSSLCINAFDMDDFFISPFHHFETFDDELIELWAKVYSRIVRELILPVVIHDGDFSARRRRLAAAER